VVKELLEKKFNRVELPKRFLPVNIHGEGKGETSIPWSSDVSDDVGEAVVSIFFFCQLILEDPEHVLRVPGGNKLLISSSSQASDIQEIKTESRAACTIDNGWPSTERKTEKEMNASKALADVDLSAKMSRPMISSTGDIKSTELDTDTDNRQEGESTGGIENDTLRGFR